MEEIEIYWISGSPYAWRAMLALEVKKLPYKTHLLVASEQEHKKPEYLAVNPRGKVPTLKVGDFIVRESLAIIAYLDQICPEPSLLGGNHEQTGAKWQAALEVDLFFAPLIIDGINRPIFFGQIDEKTEIIKNAAKELHDEFNNLESGLEKHDWMAGNEISAADLGLLPFVEGLLRATAKPEAEQLELGFVPFEEKYPAINAWRERIHKIERYGETVPLHWRN